MHSTSSNGYCSGDEEDMNDLNVETDVLYPQYGYEDDGKTTNDAPDLRVFDYGVAEVKRKLSSGSALSRTQSKQSRLYGEPTQKPNHLLPETVRYYVYSSQENGITMPIHHLLSTDGRQGLETIIKTTGWWVDCLSPTDEEMHVLAKLFRIHPLTVEDILAKEPCEKIELFPNYTFVSFRSFDTDEEKNQIWPYNFYNLIFKDGLLTFHFNPSPHPARVRQRLDRIKRHMLIVPDWIHYALIDDITDSFAPIITQVELESVSIDELSLVLHKSERSDMLKRISRCRKRATQMSRLLAAKVDVVKSLIKRYEEKWQRAGGYSALMMDEDSVFSPEETATLKTLNEVLLYLGDIQDHLVTMLQNMNHYNRMLSRAHTNYLAQVNVDLSMTYRTTNIVMNRLTFMGVIFIPVTFISSLWGMNVWVPGKDYPDNAFFFWIICMMVMYVCILTYFGIKWKIL
ncbi:uncharacterized protein BX664DRAFT_254548 [Halteromyces radiatus]|uniref:uncharacterized protein n=1 Tax=Halteromyces radiatus TaxID=101107 RepID=UPI002220B0C0|nr:uncharacterized protein BX664DRAFT_254548 [Halteromyces radiatus]KAI8098933.1 hypothetical protein BX664DRAFT_254548 [Halteromyces radiatus]